MQSYSYDRTQRAWQVKYWLDLCLALKQVIADCTEDCTVRDSVRHVGNS